MEEINYAGGISKGMGVGLPLDQTGRQQVFLQQCVFKEQRGEV